MAPEIMFHPLPVTSLISGMYTMVYVTLVPVAFPGPECLPSYFQNLERPSRIGIVVLVSIFLDEQNAWHTIGVY